MPYVYGPDGEIYQVTPQQIEAQIQAGTWWDFKPGTKINVRKGDAVFGVDFTADNLKNAYSKGYDFESDEKGHSRWAAKEYGGLADQAKVALIEGLDGMSLGASSAVLFGSGLMDKQKYDLQKEQHPDTAMAAGLAGAFTPVGAAKKGTKTLLAKALSKTPVAQVTKMAEKIKIGMEGGAKVGKDIGATIKAATAPATTGAKLQKALAAPVAHGIEGFVYGTAYSLSDALTNEAPLLSEENMAYVGSSALLGTGFGAGIPLVGKMLRAGGRKMVPKRKAPKVPEPDVPAGNPYEVGGPDLPSGERPGLWNRVMAKMVGGQPAEATNLLVGKKHSKFGRDAINQYDNHLGADTAAVTEALNAINKADDLGQKLWGDPAKAGVLAKNVAEEGVAATGQAAYNILNKLEKDLTAIFEEAAAHGAPRSISKSMAAEVKRVISKLSKSKSKQEAFEIIEAGKRRWQRRIRELRSKSRKGAGSLAEGEVLPVLGTLVDDAVRPFLENEKMWGPIGAVMKSVNASISNLAGNAKAVMKNKLWRRSGEVDYMPTFTADPGPTGSILSNAGTPATRGQNVALDTEFLLRHSDDVLDMAKKMAPHFPEMAKAIPKLEKAVKTVQERVARMSKVNKVKYISDEFTRTSGITETIGMGALGWMVGRLISDYEGGVVGGMAGAALGPKAAVRLLGIADRTFGRIAGKAAVGQNVMSARNAVRKESTGKIKSIFGKVHQARVPLAARIIKDEHLRPVEGKSQMQSFRAHASNVRTLTDPDNYMKTVQQALRSVGREYPELASQMAALGARAILHLAETAPTPYTGGSMDDMRGQEPTYSTVETSRWMRRVNIVLNPMLALDHVEQGLFTAEERETLVAVYPGMHSKWSQQLLATAIQADHLSFTQKSQLSMFIGMPLTEAMKGLQPLGAPPAQPVTGPGRNINEAKLPKFDDNDSGGSSMQAFSKNQDSG